VARGTLRIYLGAAPGVGKTFAMLDEGRRAAGRGRDVVVAAVETHGRPRTAEQLDGLEVLSAAALDVDAVLARRPELALVDDLAGPGRWQGVERLLEAGVNVVATLDVRHLESLADVVEQITGRREPDVVPDAVVRGAQQIELVDMSPEALRRRLAHGNVYPPDQVDAALADRFRTGTLAALRELALLWVADRVEESLPEAWEVRERVVVAVTGAPGGDALIRRAARIAGRTRAELVGVHVRAGEPVVDAALHERQRLLEELGGTYREVVGDDVATALVHAARAEHATQLVLGASRRPRWVELTRGSVVGAVVRDGGTSFDVHVIASAADREQVLPRVRRRLSPLTRRRRVAAVAVAVAGLPLLTLALEPARDDLGFTSVALCYLLLAVLVATLGGIAPATLAAVAGFGLLNWYFADPVHTFTIANTRDVIALSAFLVVAAVVSALVDVAARRQAEAGRARGEAEALAGMAGSLLREGDPLPKLLDHVVGLFALDGAAVVALDGTTVARSGAGDATLTLPLGDDNRLVLAGPELSAPDRRILGAFADQLALALESRRLQGEAATAAALAQANELRTALLAAVSHDLRTPLASIKTASSSLLSDVEFEPDASRALLETIDAEADRLDDLVGNLLDMSRIQTGALVVHPQPMGLEEVVGSALAGMAERGARLRLDVPETVPRVLADPALLERVVFNLVDNAVAWSPAGEVVGVEAGPVGPRVHLRVVDRGPGIPVASRDRVFQPFQRLGDSPNGMGVGLGLAVARGFVDAMGGELRIDDTPGGGTTMTVDLPAVAE
jgi:two-component system sensor histidine kinase KdpD